MNNKKSFRSYFVTTAMAEAVDLGGRQAIVTGSSMGSLGYATAKILASWGASVTLTTRQNTDEVVSALQRECGNAQVDGHPLDLCDRSSVQRFVQWYGQQHGEHLDILVNNAGIHLDLMSQWREPTLSADGVEIHWRTNYLGTVHLTRLLLPQLQATGLREGQARIVNVSSQLHSRGSNQDMFGLQRPYNSWEAYGNSKLALHHFTTELQRRYAESDNIQSYCLHPAGKNGTYTPVAQKGLQSHRLMSLVFKVIGPLHKLSAASPAEGAQTQVHCATSPEAAGGLYYQHCAPHQASIDSYDAAIAGSLWDETSMWLGASTEQDSIRGSGGDK